MGIFDDLDWDDDDVDELGMGLDVQDGLAKWILNSDRVTFQTQHVSGVRDGATGIENIRDTAGGRLADRSSYGNAPGGGINLDINMLRGMFGLQKKYSFEVSEIAGGEHSPNSRHYYGLAFDVTKINGVPVRNASASLIRQFEQDARRLGATEVLHPLNDAHHKDHFHVAWPRR